MGFLRIREFGISHFPHNKWLRKKATQAIIRGFKKYLISEADVVSAENDYEKKKIIVSRQKDKWLKKYNYIASYAKKTLSESPLYCDRQDKEKIEIEMLFAYFAYGFLPDEYIFFALEDKSYKERKEYVSDMDRLVYVFRMNDFAEKRFMCDKFETYKLLGEFYGREAISIETENDYGKFVEFIKHHPVFVKKLVFETKGHSVELIDSGIFPNKHFLFNELVSKGKTILEERIKQSEEMASFNESSLNTVRVVSINTRDGVVLPHAFLKNGHAGSFVDNGGAGGILIGIDPMTGKLISHGYDEMGNTFIRHPESGVEYMGRQLPDWNQGLELCKAAASKVPFFKYIGWDIAHTDKGWVLVEGNKAGQMVGQQMTLGRGIKAEMDALIANVDLIC